MITWRDEPVTLEGAIIGGLSLYESGALITGWWPTLTHLGKRTPRWFRALLMAGLAWWFARHFEIIITDEGQLVIVEEGATVSDLMEEAT